MGLDPFVGEVAMFGGNFAPQGWAFCDGSLLDISTNDVLFSLIGTTYGGDGINTFALPDLRGRIPLHQGQSPGTSSYFLGQTGGTETVTLTNQQTPVHTHTVISNSGTASSADPANKFLATQIKLLEYNAGSSANSTMKSNSLSITGGQPHNNIMPALTVTYIIALYGIYPSQS